jgi:anti-anti-sigma factor
MAHEGPRTTISVAGEVDLATVDVLSGAIATALERPGVELLIFDVSKLTFVDSSGLAALLGVVDRGVEVRLRQPSRLLREIVTTTGLQDVLRFEEGV